MVDLGSAVVGARSFEEHGDALYDFALSVTGDPERAVAAVREAVPGALATYGPGLSRSVLFGSVFAVAVRDAAPPLPLTGDLVEPGPGSPDELQRLARAATLLLDPVQRGCLDLALRHGLEGEALSEALGVAPGLSSVSVQAATDQAEHVIGAVLLARVGRDDCSGLADVALESVGLGAEKLAAGVVEHGGGCPACGDRRRAMVPVTTLLAGIPAGPAPAGLKKTADPGRRDLSGLVRTLRPPVRWGALPAATARSRPWRRGLGAGCGRDRRPRRRGGGAVAPPGGEIAPAAAPGGRLVVDASPVDFGPTAAQGGVRITNSGREPLVFETRAAVPWLSFVGGEGTLDPGASVVVSAVLDRLGRRKARADSGDPGPVERRLAAVAVRAVVERAPEVSGVAVTPQAVAIRRCPGSTPAQVRVAVIEESGLKAVELHWVRHGNPVEQVSPMIADGGSSYRGALGPFDTPGHVHWWVSAVDIRDNGVETARQELRVGGC